jgi:GNAT superfamily N-acetyltransferase
VVPELRFHRRHVDLDRAVARAPLAGQAEVESVLDLIRLPAVGDDLALEHLEQQPGAATRRVLLLTRDHVARAHHGRGIGDAALAYPDAAQRVMGEVALVK